MEERYNLISNISRFTFHVSRFTLLVVLLGGVIGCSGKDEPLRQSEALIESGMHPEAINLLEKIIAARRSEPEGTVSAKSGV